MKIEAITLRELQIPLVHFFETSFGRTYNRRVLLVTLHCDGLEGWGECVAGEEPYYSEEYIDGAWDVIVRYLGPSLLGRTLNAGRRGAAAAGQSARASHGQGRAGKRSVGCRVAGEGNPAVEAAERHPERNRLRRQHRHSGFARAITAEDRDGTRRRLPAHQTQGEARDGTWTCWRKCARAGRTFC